LGKAMFTMLSRKLGGSWSDCAVRDTITGCQFDYGDEPGGGFFLSTMQEVKSE